MYDMMVTYCCWLDDLIVLCAGGGTFVKKRFCGETLHQQINVHFWLRLHQFLLF